MRVKMDQMNTIKSEEIGQGWRLIFFLYKCITVRSTSYANANFAQLLIKNDVSANW